MRENLFSELIILIIFSLIPTIIIKIKSYFRGKNKKELYNEIEYSFGLLLKEPSNYIHLADKTIDELRNKLVKYLVNKKINHEDFSLLNERINANVNKLRMNYLKSLFINSSELREALDFMFADEKITQNELMELVKLIGQTKELDENSKTNLIKDIKINCIINNRVKDTKDLLRELNILGIPNKKLIFKYALIFLPFIISMIYLIIRYGEELGIIEPPDITFAAIVFSDKDRFEDYATKFSSYLSDKTGNSIKVRLLTFDDVHEIENAIVQNKFQGLILNPGTFSYLYKNSPGIFSNYMEMLGYHEENKKAFYKSALVTKRSEFCKYLKRIGRENIEINPERMISEEEKIIIKNYLKGGIFAFTHANSLSGYSLPVSYLWSEFKININTDNPKYNLNYVMTSSHDNSVKGLLDGKFRAIAIYDALLEDQFSENINEFLILYLSPDIPYNSYFIRKDLNSKLKNSLIFAFSKLDKENSEHALLVKQNKMKITGWKTCNFEDYFEKIEGCLAIIQTKLPKPAIIFRPSENTNREQKIYLKNIVKEISSKLKKINAWQLVFDEDNIVVGSNKYVIEIDLIKIPDKDSYIYRGSLITESYDDLLFKFTVNSLNNETEKMLQDTVILKVIEKIPPKYMITYDNQGVLFINCGKEDGLQNCYLELENGERIRAESYNVEINRVVFNTKIIDPVKYNKKYVNIRYNFSAISD